MWSGCVDADPDSRVLIIISACLTLNSLNIINISISCSSIIMSLLPHIITHSHLEFQHKFSATNPLASHQSFNLHHHLHHHLHDYPSSFIFATFKLFSLLSLNQFLFSIQIRKSPCHHKTIISYTYRHGTAQANTISLSRL